MAILCTLDLMFKMMKLKTVLIVISLILFLSGCKNGGDGFLKSYKSDYNATKTAKLITKALEPKNYHLLRVINYEKEAREIDFYLRPTLTLEIDNPKITSKLLECNPTLTTDLPIRIGIYTKLDGSTYLVYTNPEYWSLKHNIKDKVCIELINLIARDFDEAKDVIKQSK